MIDWHSHILPNIDDGSKSVEESLNMLRSLKSQGVDTVVATPHFYAKTQSVERFLERRQQSFSRLEGLLDDDMPKILLGAEVKYYNGISRLTDIDKLKIEGSNLLLLEMNSSKWGDYTIRELAEIQDAGRLYIVLAHIERYLDFQKKGVADSLIQNDIMLQINASYLNDFFGRKKAISMLKKGTVRFIGSDCHNMEKRAPNIKKAYDYVEKKLGKEFVDRICEFGEAKLLGVK